MAFTAVCLIVWSTNKGFRRFITFKCITFAYHRFNDSVQTALTTKSTVTGSWKRENSLINCRHPSYQFTKRNEVKWNEMKWNRVINAKCRQASAKTFQNNIGRGEAHLRGRSTMLAEADLLRKKTDLFGCQIVDKYFRPIAMQLRELIIILALISVGGILASPASEARMSTLSADDFQLCPAFRVFKLLGPWIGNYSSVWTRMSSRALPGSAYSETILFQEQQNRVYQSWWIKRRLRRCK